MMKNFRLTVSSLAVIALTVGAITGVGATPASAATVQVTIGLITYTADNGNVAAGATVTSTNVVGEALIPRSVVIGGTTYLVTAIGSWVFANKSLTRVSIPSTVTTIGDYAFAANPLLTEVSIPSGVKNIGQYAFSNTRLTSLTIPPAVGTIGQGAFAGNNLMNVTIPDGVTSIGPDAFSGNENLTSVLIAGAAPTITITSANTGQGSFGGVAVINYLPSNASGFASPWNGYNTASVGPTISGFAEVGNELTVQATDFAKTGAGLTYAWTRSGSSNVIGTKDTYVPTVDDIGATLTVTQTGTWPGLGRTTLASSATMAVVAGLFGTTTVPTISGVAKVGQTLTAHMSQWWSWSPTPTTLTLAWTRSGSDVVLGTDDTYTLTAADVGSMLIVTATAARDGYASAIVPSSETAAVVSGTFPTTPTPTISGLSQVGKTLTANPGIWPEGTTFAYAWRQVGADTVLSGLDAYTPAATDLGKYLIVTVTASLAGYSDAVVVTAPSVVVAAGIFTDATAPTITGTAQVGVSLRATVGSWATGATLTYAWTRAGSTTVIGTAANYTPVTLDIGKVLTVKVTATRAGFTTLTTPGAVTAAVVGLPFSASPAPTITGTKTVGSTLTAATTGWNPSAGVTFTYVWKRADASDGVKTAITGATGKTYKVVALDRGKYLTVTVTASKSGYASTTISSSDGVTKIATLSSR